MNKINLVSGFAGLVLSAGLVSCSPEKKNEIDNYRVDPPKVIRHSAAGVETLNLKAWSESPNKDLDLQDQIDVAPANAKALEVKANCRLLERDYISVSKVVSPTLLSLFQIVPSEILTADLEKSPVNCQFEMVFLNEVGSRHVFNFSSMRVRDQVTSKVTFEKEGKRLTERLRISATSSANHRVRTSHRHDRAQIDCQEIRFPSISFAQGLELSAFDFSKYELLPNHDARILQSDPVQLCRMIFIKGNIVQEISPLFNMTMETAPLEKVSSSPLSQWPSKYEQAKKGYHAFRKFTRGLADPEIGQLTLKNVDTYARRLQIEKKILRGQVLLFYKINNISRARSVLPWSALLQITSDSGAQIVEAEKNWSIVLPAESSVTLRLRTSAPNTRGTPADQCAVAKEFQAVGYEVADTIKVSEITPDGEIYFEQDLKFDKIYFSWTGQPLPAPEEYREMSCSDLQRAN